MQRDLSKSCQEGFENSKYENILVMDGDLQHDPIYIPEMINEFEKYNCDIVIGARDLLIKRIEGLGYLRQEISKILIKIINIFFIMIFYLFFTYCFKHHLPPPIQT